MRIIAIAAKREIESFCMIYSPAIQALAGMRHGYDVLAISIVSYKVKGTPVY
jgi:hypothetical protein